MERVGTVLRTSAMGQAWLVVHIVLVLAGYAALLLTAVAAVVYLIQERRLKTKQTSSLLERLPPLATLDNLISKSLGLGFRVPHAGAGVRDHVGGDLLRHTQLDQRRADHLVAGHLGAAAGDDVPARFGGMARTQGGA